MNNKGNLISNTGVLYKMIDVSGDGNCFFWSLVIDPLFAKKGFSHLTLRKYVCQSMKHTFEK